MNAGGDDYVWHIVSPGEDWSNLSSRYRCPAAPYKTPERFLCEYNQLDLTQGEMGCGALDTQGGEGPPLVPQKDMLVIPPDCKGAYRVERRKNQEQEDIFSTCRGCNWSPVHGSLRSGSLMSAMLERGFQPPEGFRALVVRTDTEDTAQGRRIIKHTVWDYDGFGFTSRGWNPASTVKLFSGVAAVGRLNQLGLDLSRPEKLMVSFDESTGERTFSLDELLEDSLHWSKNHSHNRLAWLGGYDYINGPSGILRRSAGLADSYIRRGYALSRWRELGNDPYLANSPSILVRHVEGFGELASFYIPETRSNTTIPCSSAACTSLSDLAKLMCLLIHHEALDSSERITDLDAPICAMTNGKCALPNPAVDLLRSKLNRTRKGRGDPVWQTLQRELGSGSRGHELSIFRKSGWAGSWGSDVLFIEGGKVPDQTQWIVAAACYGTRHCLTDGERNAIQILSELIRSSFE